MRNMKENSQINSEKECIELPFGDPSPVLTMIFAFLCICFWANTMGFFTEGAILAIGVAQLAVFTSYTIGGVILLRNGNSFGGNTFLIFATIFGGIGGGTHVAMVLAAEHNIDFCYRICGIAFIIAGLFLLCMLPGLRYSTKVDFICFLTGGLGILGYGLTGAGLAPKILDYFSAWFLLIDGLTGFYSVIVMMLGFLGIQLSLGIPFLKK